MSLGIFGTIKGRTYLCVAIDNFNSHHNSLQLSIEDQVTLKDTQVNIWHDGKMTVGNLGAAKKGEVIQYIKENSEELIINNRVFLGRLDNSQPLYINSKEVGNFLCRVMNYAILRDEYRGNIKSSNTM